jgi:DNA-directed RNA polymerase subunit beta'
MAVHVPLSDKAVQEARRLMLASKNLLKPADGEPIIAPSKDMVLGVFYMTMLQARAHKGDGRIFADIDEVDMVYQLAQVDLHSRIKIRMNTWYAENGDRLPEAETRIIETTVGRVLFNRILPEKVQFINRQLEKGGIKDLIAEVYELYGQDVTTETADAIKRIGFEYAMRSGTTIAVSDITIPPEKAEIIDAALKDVELVHHPDLAANHQRRCQGRQGLPGSGWQPGHYGQLRCHQRWFRPHQPVGWHARIDG